LRPHPTYQRFMAKTTLERPLPVARIDDAEIAGYISRMRAGERRAIATVITELERLSAAAPGLLCALQPHLGHALVVGNPQTL
jgi:LAO/AO transport system kinase